jgi:hypothetical protein
VRLLFDEVLSALEVNSRLYIGPGTFETRGNASEYFPQSGQKIVGSGVDVTFIKLVVAAVPEPRLYHALAVSDYLQFATHVEISDLTINCNMAAHPYGSHYSTLAKAGISTVGSHHRIRRVRIIDYGSQTNTHECFALGVGGAHSHNPEVVDPVIDECILELPSPNNIRETSCIGVLGGFLPPFNRAGVIRNCILDGRYAGEKSSQKISIDQQPGALQNIEGLTYRFRTATPHLRTLANNVVIQSVSVPGETGLDPSKAFNGDFKIDQIYSETEFDFTLRFDPYVVDGITDFSQVNLSFAAINLAFHGVGANGGTSAVVESNRVLHMWLASYTDSWSTNDVVYRNNYWADVFGAHYELLGGKSGAVACTLSNNGTVATLTVPGGHRYFPGQIVHVFNARRGSTLDPYFNGYFEVVDVPASPVMNGLPQTLTYAMHGVPTGPPTNPLDEPPLSCREFWTGRHIAVERNVIELTRGLRPDARSSGVILTGSEDTGEPLPHIYRRVAVGENVIRQFNLLPDPLTLGVFVGRCGKAIVQNNVLNLGSIKENLVCDYRSDGVSYFKNQRASGAPLAGRDLSTPRWRDELHSRIEEALVVGL